MAASKFTAESVKELYQRRGAALAAYGCCCGLDFGTAEDVVQQIFLKLLQSKAPQVSVGYLYRAVRNASLNYHRDRRREAAMPEDEIWFTHATAGHVELLELQSALRELPDEQRETVFMRIWSGMTLQEIADVTEVSLNTVASRYRYALAKLRECLGDWVEKGKAHNAKG